jgi:hypothetical protein
MIHILLGWEKLGHFLVENSGVHIDILKLKMEKRDMLLRYLCDGHLDKQNF